MQVQPSAYFPSLAYVRALLQDPQLVLDFKEHFVKQSIRTRAEILSANGVIQLNPAVAIKVSGQGLVRRQRLVGTVDVQADDHFEDGDGVLQVDGVGGVLRFVCGDSAAGA